MGVASLRRPVLLVHGILGTRHLYWNLFRRRLEADGFRAFEAGLPFVLLGDLRKAAEALARDIVELKAREGIRGRIDIVAHSAGGLVSRYYIQRLGGHRHVANLVLLATPHQGTLASYLVPVLKVASQSAPGSQLLGELNSRRPPASVRITNFWSPFDGIVVPARNSVLRAPGVRNVRLARMHHWGFLVSTAVCDEVKRVLRPAASRPAAPRRPRAGAAPRRT